MGPRRTRLFSQIAATMVGASFVLGAQAVAMLPDRMRASVLSIFAPPKRRCRVAGEGAPCRLARSLTDVATSPAGRLYDAGRGDFWKLAGALSWIALSANDAPDFLATAPIARSAIERGKVAAIGQPIALILALPLIGLGFASPWAGRCALLFGAGAIASSALVNLWRQAPSRRGLVLRRHSQSKLVGLMEHLVSILWAVAAAIALIGSWAVLVPLAAVAAVLAINWKWVAIASPARS